MTPIQLIPFAMLPLALIFVLTLEWWRRKVIRKSLELSDELVGLLSEWEVRKLNQGLRTFLLTREGQQLVDDPRVKDRMQLLASRIDGFDAARAAARRARALRISGLKELPADSEGPA